MRRTEGSVPASFCQALLNISGLSKPWPTCNVNNNVYINRSEYKSIKCLCDYFNDFTNDISSIQARSGQNEWVPWDSCKNQISLGVRLEPCNSFASLQKPCPSMKDRAVSDQRSEWQLFLYGIIFLATDNSSPMSLFVRVHSALCLCPKRLFERQPVAGGPSHYSQTTAGLQMLPRAQISFDRPGEEHRHVSGLEEIGSSCSGRWKLKLAPWVVALGGRNAAQVQANSEIWNSVCIWIIKQQLCRQPNI